MLQWDAFPSAEWCPCIEMLPLKAMSGQWHPCHLSPQQQGVERIIYSAGKSLTLDISAAKGTSCAAV